MQAISDVIAKIVKERQLSQDGDKLAKSALQDPAVRDFLQKNQNVLNKEIIANSLANLYSYAQQIKDPNKVMAGYTPKLFLNGKTIDITYEATAEKVKHDQKARAEKRIELIDLPLKLRHVELAEVDQTPERKDALLAIAAFLKNFEHDHHAKGLYLEGDFGVGKTYLLAGLANSIARQGSRVIFLHVPSFIASLGSHFQDNSLSEEIDRIAQAPVLIFDDIGAETLSEWSRDDVLGVILQKRMDNVLPTFFSSNMTMADLAEHFSNVKNVSDELKAKRLMERVKFLSQEIFVGGENRRH